MSNVNSAVQNVTPARGRRTPSAATTAAPPAAGPGRGKQPEKLKNGKLLSEERARTKAALGAAKDVARTAKQALATATREERLAAKNLVAANKALAAAEAKPLPDKAAQKASVANLKAAVKTALQAQKVAAKNLAAATKSLEKADAGVVKAHEGVAAVEAARVTAG